MVDTIFEALASEYRRRLLIDLLDDASRPVSIPAGASWEIAEANEDLLRSHLSSSRAMGDVDEDLLRLRHVHLPKLDDHGFVEWDRDAHVVARGPRFDEIRPLLELLDGRRNDLPSAWLQRREISPRVVESPSN